MRAPLRQDEGETNRVSGSGTAAHVNLRGLRQIRLPHDLDAVHLKASYGRRERPFVSCPKARVRDEPSRPRIEVGQGVRARRRVEANGITLALYRIRGGTALSVHSHLMAEIGVVLSGSGLARLGDEDRVLHAGDAFYVSPGTYHNFRADEPVMMLNVTVPLHDDGEETAEPIEELAARTLRAPGVHRPKNRRWSREGLQTRRGS